MAAKSSNMRRRSAKASVAMRGMDSSETGPWRARAHTHTFTQCVRNGHRGDGAARAQRTRARPRPSTHAHPRARTHASTRARAHTNTQTHTHTHSQSWSYPPPSRGASPMTGPCRNARANARARARRVSDSPLERPPIYNLSGRRSEAFSLITRAHARRVRRGQPPGVWRRAAWGRETGRKEEMGKGGGRA